MGVSKVTLGNQVIFDLTNDTVTPGTLLQGVIAHDASGKRITGALKPVSKTTSVNIDVGNGVTVSYYTLAGEKIELSQAVTTINALGGIVTVCGGVPDVNGTYTNYGEVYVFLEDGGTLSYNNYSELVTYDDNLFETADSYGFAVRRS